MRHPRIILTLLSAFLAVAGSLAAQDAPPVPVVVAVDTSRSLLPGELAAIVARLRAALAELDDDTPAALLAFDDQPRWLRRPGASLAEVRVVLGDLTPRGDFTLLHDALFAATRELPEGGVILLATDGRDENSATTVEDIARRCETQSVRIVSVGAGHAVAERSLRRLALLSDGAYLGAAGRAEPAAIAGAVGDARQAVSAALAAGRVARLEAARQASPAPGEDASSRREANGVALRDDRLRASGATDSGDPQTAPASAGSEPAGSSSWPYAQALGALALLVAGALALWLWLRRRGGRPDYCQKCGTELEPGQIGCDQCQALDLRTELARRPAATLDDAPEVTVDTAVFHQMNLSERLEKTQILQNQSVLLVKKPGEAPRSFLLGHDRAFAVGREREGNTLRVPDPALSAHHFKIVPEGDGFYFVDLESTNGSFVNGDRTPVKELRSGDVIRAGQVEFEFKSHADF